MVDLFIIEYFPGFGKSIFQPYMNVKTKIFLFILTMLKPAGDLILSFGFFKYNAFTCLHGGWRTNFWKSLPNITIEKPREDPDPSKQLCCCCSSLAFRIFWSQFVLFSYVFDSMIYINSFLSVASRLMKMNRRMVDLQHIHL